MHSTDFILETTQEKFHQKAKTAIFEFVTDHVIWEPSPFLPSFLNWRAIFELILESLEKVYFMVQMPFLYIRYGTE